MGHFTRVRVDLAAWSYGSGVSQAEFNKFDTNLFKAINGDDGGTWAPSSAIVIGGAGIQLEALARFNGSVVLGNDVMDAITVGGTSTFNANATFNGYAYLNGTTIIGSDGTFAALGPAYFSGGISGNVTFGGNITHNGTVSFYSGVNIGDSAADTCIVTANAYFNNGVFLNPGSNFSCGGSFAVGGAATFAGAEEHNAAEVHKGTEQHNGACQFNSITISAGGERSAFEVITSSVTRDHASANVFCVNMSVGGSAILLESPGSTDYAGKRKFIKNIGSLQFAVHDQGTGAQVALLDANESVFVVTDGVRWY